MPSHPPSTIRPQPEQLWDRHPKPTEVGPSSFDENTYSFPNRVFTKTELLGYLDFCRSRVRRTLDGLTEEAAARSVPDAHRYRGMLYGVIVGGMPLHVVEHASQIRQFLTAAGVKVQPMPGDRGYAPDGS